MKKQTKKDKSLSDVLDKLNVSESEKEFVTQLQEIGTSTTDKLGMLWNHLSQKQKDDYGNHLIVFIYTLIKCITPQPRTLILTLMEQDIKDLLNTLTSERGLNKDGI